MAVRSDFTPDATYDVAQINLLAGCFIKSGCIGKDDLKVVYKNGTAIVSEGSCILPDKSRLTVAPGGCSIPVQYSDGYIYIENGEIKYGDLPEGENLLLARIEDGILSDLRSRAYIYSTEGVK